MSCTVKGMVPRYHPTERSREGGTGESGPRYLNKAVHHGVGPSIRTALVPTGRGVLIRQPPTDAPPGRSVGYQTGRAHTGRPASLHSKTSH